MKVDRATGQFQCAEHGRRTAVAPASLQGVQQGDIVKVDRNGGSAPRLVLLRSAAAELSSPEN